MRSIVLPLFRRKVGVSLFCTRLSSSELEGQRKRMLYHSKMRGWLELDLIMGTFGERYLPTLSEKDLEDYAKVLDEENPDLFKWISGQVGAPDHLKELPVVQLLLKHVNENHPSTFQNK